MHFKYKSLPLVTSVNVQADYSPPIVNTRSHLNELRLGQNSSDELSVGEENLLLGFQFSSSGV